MLGTVSMRDNYVVPYGNAGNVTPIHAENNIGNSSKVKPVECQTCKARKYVDGSNEADVSFKTPGHIDPSQSYAKVMSHEQEHVANARQETAGNDAELVSVSVSLKMAVCPECGRTYVAGGTTNTMIKYNNDNPYEDGRKTIEGSFLKGQNVDESV